MQTLPRGLNPSMEIIFSYSDVIRILGYRELADYLAIKEGTARQWHYRNRIPANYFAKIIELAQKRGFIQIDNDLFIQLARGHPYKKGA